MKIDTPRRHPIVLGYVGDDGAPHLSYRGSTQVFGKNQLAIWVRNPDAGLPKAVRNHPQVTLLYSSAEPRRLLTFKGRARLDPSVNETVYGNSPKGERDRDPDRKGVARYIRRPATRTKRVSKRRKKNEGGTGERSRGARPSRYVDPRR